MRYYLRLEVRAKYVEKNHSNAQLTGSIEKVALNSCKPNPQFLKALIFKLIFCKMLIERIAVLCLFKIDYSSQQY